MKTWGVIATLAIFAACVAVEVQRLIIKPFPPQRFGDEVSEFKYGSIGAETNGYPYAIWRELPSVFADRLPGGWRDFGFLLEEGHDVPIGISVRRTAVERVGFNCATCHTASITTANATHIVLGAPAQQLDLQAYLRFLVEASNDARLTPEAVFESADAANRPISWLDQQIVRFIVFPQLASVAAELKESLSWMDRKPDHGPGRTDAGNFWRARWLLHPENDDLIGTVDFPAVWRQRDRLQGWFHWGGDNSSLTERNYSAALAGGATEWLLDQDAIGGVSDWLLDLESPAFPAPVNAARAEEGKLVFDRENCGTCHAVGGSQFGNVTDIDVVGTDPARAILFSSDMVARFQDVGAPYSWRFTHYRSSHGYANIPLDGIWARGPYLHNGSVPTLAALLSPVAERPARFHRGCDRFDPLAVGFNCSTGFLHDATLPGNGNGGHLYGVGLAGPDKAALIEYLKTL